MLKIIMCINIYSVHKPIPEWILERLKSQYMKFIDRNLFLEHNFLVFKSGGKSKHKNKTYLYNELKYKLSLITTEKSVILTSGKCLQHKSNENWKQKPQHN